jgi:hypothetical protein
MDRTILIHRRRFESCKQILVLLLRSTATTATPGQILLPSCTVIIIVEAVDTIDFVHSQIPVSRHKPAVTCPCTRVRIDNSSSIVAVVVAVAAVVAVVVVALAPVQTATLIMPIKPTVTRMTTTTILH